MAGLINRDCGGQALFVDWPCHTQGMQLGQDGAGHGHALISGIVVVFAEDLEADSSKLSDNMDTSWACPSGSSPVASYRSMT
jgi:hypothetical protein